MKVLVFSMMLVITTPSIYAQDWKSILGNVAGKVEEVVSQVKEGTSIEGTWQYVEPDCKFESDDFLSKAGGEIAARKIEDEMAEYLSKLGFNEGTVYTFNSDGSYSSTVGKRTVNGTYTYDKETKIVSMKTKLGLKFDARIAFSYPGGKARMSMLFRADKLMSLAQAITGGLSGKTSNSTVSTINTLLEKYDGLMLGFALQKK